MVDVHASDLPKFADAFTSPAIPGETLKLEVDGFVITATIHSDPDIGAPWKESDGHGPVSGWRHGNSKRPGELELNDDGASSRFYDFAEACRIARRDGWGVAGGRLDGETARQYAARAAMADFQHLKAWCDDEWQWVGVALQVSKEGVDLTGDYGAALWGIDSLSADHITDTANDLIREALNEAQATLDRLKAA